MELLETTLNYFKSDMYLVPRAKEQEYRRKYEIYMEKLRRYKIAHEKMTVALEGDEEKMREIKHKYDPERYGGLNQETQLLYREGLETQDASKQALLRIK